jgi:hypothetical protein
MQSWTSVRLWNVNLTIHDGIFVCTIDRFGGKGAQIIGNHFTNGAALLGRTKSSVSRLVSATSAGRFD